MIVDKSNNTYKLNAKNQTFQSHLWPGIFKIQFFNQKFEFYCMDKGRSPEFLEINRPTSQKASSWLSKGIAHLCFFLNVQIKYAKEAVKSESSFFNSCYSKCIKKDETTLFLCKKQHILA